MASPDEEAQQRRPALRIALAVVRIVAIIGVLLALYYNLPFDHEGTWAVVTTLAIGLVALVGLVIFHVRSVRASPYPTVRAVEALSTNVPLFLLLFASTYFALEHLSPGNFSEHLTRSDSLYFTVTVFSTVGFGDITPKTELARLLVTGQIVADVLFIAVAIKVIVGTVKSRRPIAGSTPELANRAA